MFYNQAAATVHYLYHAGPELRAAMLRYVAEHYKGKTTKDSIQKIFGMSATDLGKRVIEYAKQQTQPPAKR